MRVKGFNNYELDPINGTCYNTRTKRFVGNIDKRDGYVSVTLFEDNRKRTVKLHTLMAEHFIPNQKFKRTVHHINHVRTDNRVSNLTWATDSEQHDKEWLLKTSKSIRVFNDTFSKEFMSIREASRELGLNPSGLRMVLKGKYKHTGGYRATLVDKENKLR
ncbi:putative HNH endonuclease [Weissella phage phiYS61]|uniref:putative HNH endonuclease n=1 Tax=Weissella phage phiYS61 TaxID=1161906 RepID=UPI000274E251|nr:putative HNH endonuclease [Weissella phage phiYS61]AFF28000.1 putative HNH endonuclease [Weissella phage phiYS61]